MFYDISPEPYSNDVINSEYNSNAFIRTARRCLCARCVKIRSLRFEFDILKNQRRKSVMGCASRIKQGRDRLPFGSRAKVDEEAILSHSSQLQSADAWGYGQEIPGAPTTAFYHADGIGNVPALTYANQRLAAKYLYDPFGNMISMSGTLRDFNKYRFSSKEWNENSGLYYYLYRFYDPSLQPCRLFF